MKYLLLVFVIFVSTPSRASLESLHRAQEQEEQRVQQAMDEVRKKAEVMVEAQLKAKKHAYAQAELRRQKIIESKRVTQQALISAKALEQKNIKQRQLELLDREHAYEDELRVIELIERRALAEAQAISAQREVDVRIENAEAHNDVIHSQAEATRKRADALHLEAQGAKSLKENLGEAELKKSSGWFG